MSTNDVIIIEDSPPSSPLKTKKKQIPYVPKPIQEAMYYQPHSHEFPVGEQAIIWSRNTTNFIKQSMSSIQQNSRMPLLNNTMQNKSVQFMSRPYLPRNGYQFNGVRSYPTPPYTIYNYDPFVNPYCQMNGYRPIGSSAYLNDLYNRNFWMKVKLEESSDKHEVVSQYYLDDNLTPVEMNRNEHEVEFIDINTFVNNYGTNSKETNEYSLTTATDDKKRMKNPVPLFLKRSRPVINNTKMKIPEENTQLDSSNNNKEDGEDVIFVGAFKREEKLSQISTEENAKTSSQTSNSSDQSYKPSYSKSSKSSSYKFGKRKRKDRTLVPLRRNPKRQVQIEKEFLKMIDDVIFESDKEEKHKKTAGDKQNKLAAKTAVKQHRRSHGVLANSGAVYNPPSPLTNDHIRDWPAEGMHERPEYDPVSGKILPFDNIIRNISDTYNTTKKNTKENLVQIDLVQPAHLEKKKTFPELCHEMLHHVIAYIATVKMLEREEKTKENECTKKDFLEKIDLQKREEKVENKICDILHSIVDESTKKSDTTNELAELLKNTMLIYCLTNNVDKSDVAKYIASVKPEDIIKLSNEQLKLLPISGN